MSDPDEPSSADGNPPPAARRPPPVIRAVTRGILADQRTRRRVMGGIILTAAAMLMVGTTIAATWLVERPLLFIVFWFACGWLTITAVLLAVFDMLLVRKAGIAARRQLKRDVFGRHDDQDDDD